MEVISTANGFILKFESLDSLKGTVDNLKGQIEFIKENEIDPPHLYSLYAEETTAKEITNKLNEIKEIYQSRSSDKNE